MKKNNLLEKEEEELNNFNKIGNAVMIIFTTTLLLVGVGIGLIISLILKNV